VLPIALIKRSAELCHERDEAGVVGKRAIGEEDVLALKKDLVAVMLERDVGIGEGKRGGGGDGVGQAHALRIDVDEGEVVLTRQILGSAEHVLVPLGW